MSKRLWMLLTAVSLLVGLVPLTAFADHSPDDTVGNVAGANETPFWVNYLSTERGIEDAVCQKLNVTGGGAFVMPDEPAGRDWVLLVIKQASGELANSVFYDPIAGHSYSSVQTQPGFSHIIVCSVEEPVFVPDPALSVTKTAEASYDLEHLWDIDKSADPTSLFLPVDGSGDATVTWTVDVTYEGSSTSNEMVTGTITIDNTGNVDARIDSVTDVLDTGEAGVVDCGVTFPQVLDAFTGQLVCTYSVDADGIAATLNTATASGEFAIDEEGTFDGSDPFSEDGDAAVSFVLGTETNATVNINDLSDLFGDVDLGSVTAPNGDSFTYTKDFAYEDFGQEGCGVHTYDNTATIVETGQSDSETVTVDVECLVFEGETVTGAGLPWSDVGSGKKKVNTWFEYSPKGAANSNQGFDATGTVDLIQGRPRNVVGSATLTDLVGPTTQICFDLDSPWVLADVAGNVKIQPLASQPTSYLSPGSFAHHFTEPSDLGETTSSFCVTVPDANYGYAIHLDAGQWVSGGPTLNAGSNIS